MNTEELLGQFTKVGLNVAGTYVEYHFKQYHASKDQSQKVHRMMEDTLLGTSRLFSVSAPIQELKSGLRNMLQPLSQETRKLDDMTIRLPLKRLQRKRLVRTVLIFTESSDQLSRATDRVPGLPASPGYVQ